MAVAAKVRGVLLCCMSMLALSAHGSPGAAAPYLSLDHYGLQQGLSQSAVTSIAEDARGFLWLGTQEGLNRFDGHRFVVYRSDDPSRPLSSSSVDSIAVDALGRLWVGTNETGLEVIEPGSSRRGRLDAQAGLSHDTVRHVLPDDAGGAWLGTAAGIDRIDAALGAPRRLGRTAAVVGLQRADDGRIYALDIECRLYRVGTDALQPLPLALPGEPRCAGLQLTPAGLWLASSFDALWLVDADGRLLRSIDAPAPAERTALGRFNDAVLIGHADGRVLLLDDDAVSLRPVELDRPLDSAVLRFHQQRSGVLWIGTLTSGLFRTRALSQAVRRDLVSDADRAGWPTRSVRSVWTGPGHALIGTDAGLVWRRAGSSGWQPVAAIGATSIRRILAHPDGGWWIGSHHGLWRLHEDGRVAQVDVALPDPQITDLLYDGRQLWISTRGGLARLPAAPVPAALSRLFLTSLLPDQDGRLWVGSNEEGLFRLSPDGTVETFDTAGGRLRHDSVWSLYADRDAVWIGSYGGGLQRLDRASVAVTAYTTGEGLPNNVVYASLPDSSGRLWLSTNNGLGVLDPASGVIQTLAAGDGLRNREFNSGAGFVGSDGMLYFGGTEGLDVIDPKQLAAHSAPAFPAITGVRLLGRRDGAGSLIDVMHRQSLELDYRDAIISLDLVAIDFTAPDAARLRYRLGGVDADWVRPAGPATQLVLSHLPSGDYRLEVEAAGRDGKFGAPATLALTVLPPPWRHPLAWLGYACIAAALVWWMGWRLRTQARRKRDQIELLNHTVEQRTAELARANRLLQQSNQQLDSANRTDPLTQVSNRRELAEWMRREAPFVSGDDCGDRRLLFFMIDLDDFKRINDRFGHQVGDEVLVATASRLRRLCREHDIVVRWGGEEFLMLVRARSAGEAPALAERIRHAIAAAPVDLDCGQVLPVTCSVGFAAWPFAPQWRTLGDWEQSVALADRALYAAKAAGKNAWVGLAAGLSIDRSCLQQLLAGSSPAQLPDGCVAVLHSDGAQPMVR